MSDCLNEEMRDLLPALAAGSLAPSEAARVRAHLAGCASCDRELAVLETTRRVLIAQAPRIDTSRIVSAIADATAAPRTATPALTVVRGGAVGRSRGLRMPRRYLAAAATLLVVGTLSVPAVRERVFGSGGTAGDSIGDVAAASAEVTGLGLSGGLTDLSDADLTALLAALDAMEPTVASEPVSLRSALLDDPEGP
jgi:hypothetical protein